MQPKIQVRQFRYPQDYQQVHDLWAAMEKGVQVGRSDTPAEIEKKLARDPDLFLVAEAGDRIVGSVIGGYDGRRGMVYHLAVEPSFRNERKNGQPLDQVGELLAQDGWYEPEWLVVQGPPEKAAGYMRGQGLVAASYPGKDGARAELLAHLANPVLLFPEQHEE